jgi:hypothetical protein
LRDSSSQCRVVHASVAAFSNKFERVRYPDELLTKGMIGNMELTRDIKAQSQVFGMKTTPPSFSLGLEDIDDLTVHNANVADVIGRGRRRHRQREYRLSVVESGSQRAISPILLGRRDLLPVCMACPVAVSVCTGTHMGAAAGGGNREEESMKIYFVGLIALLMCGRQRRGIHISR